MADRPPSRVPPGTGRPVSRPSPAPGPVDPASRTRDLLQVAPKIEVPTGGGALRGIGETFRNNPVTGSSGLDIPLGFPPGRGGLSPSVGLSYDSGAGNGVFGMGMMLAVPSICRKTDRQLPRYRDDQASDTFLLSDAEDLVPVDATRTVTDDAGTWTVQRYRPRIETDFALVERWSPASGVAEWRVRTRTNVLRRFGTSNESRVADPSDATRIAAWLLDEESDEVGNVVRYRYDVVSGGSPGTGHAEVGRLVAWRHLKRVQYANRSVGTLDDGWYFEVVFDYGEHDDAAPELTPDPSSLPDVRLDPYSTHRAGFDQRCHRLCRRVLVFHRFSDVSADDGQDVAATLIRSVDFAYDENPVATTLSTVTVRGWAADGTSETLPPLALTWIAPSADSAPAYLDGIDDLPNGIDFSRAQWVDLDGEGLSGLLTEAGEAWWYKRNEGEGRLGAWRPLPSRPGVSLAGVQLADIDGDGRLEIVDRRAPPAGSWARTAEGGWDHFQPFKRIPAVIEDGRNSRSLDVDGDGRPDLLVADTRGLLLFRSDGRDGWLAPERIARAADEALGPTLLFASARESLFLADMDGDGLTDLVRVRNGSICYWPNLGYGRFGPRVDMVAPPWLDRSDRFDPRRVRLADIDGTGAADLVYIGPELVRWWSNQSGNGFSTTANVVHALPGVADPLTVSVADLRGDGTACLVWASPLARDRFAPLRYIRLQKDGKPYLLQSVDNHQGRTIALEYTPSTAFYLADRRAGTPWATRLPFPVHCLSAVTTTDAVTGLVTINRYAYHHGYFDGVEREFRGFGRIETWDTDSYPEGAGTAEQPTVRTVRWYHTGAWREDGDLRATYGTEYFAGDTSAFDHPDNAFDVGITGSGWTGAEWREAYRALKGHPLREEVYGEDDPSVPFAVTASAWTVRRLARRSGDTPSVFWVAPRTNYAYHYERDASDPRVTQSLTLDLDDWGTLTRTAAIAFPRRGTVTDVEQATGVVTVAVAAVIHDVDPTAERWHVGLPWRATTWHLHDASATFAAPADADTVNTTFDDGATVLLAFDDAEPGGGNWRRRLADRIVTYAADDATESDVGTVGSRALVHQTYSLAFTTAQAADLLAGVAAPGSLDSLGYVDLTGVAAFTSLSDISGAWARSGTQARDASTFYLPIAFSDPRGGTTNLTWHSSALFPATVTDPLDNPVVATWDTRALAPDIVQDPNGSRTLTAFDIHGRVVAVAQAGKDGGTDGDTLDDPTITFTYDLTAVPVKAVASHRETHGSANLRWIDTTTYSDGAGNAVMQKVTAAPDPDTGAPRWRGTGRVVLNAKGLPIKQYEPFYATTDTFEAEEGFSGVTPILTYDALGRAVRVDLPNGTLRRVAFDPWQQSTWDENDTIDESTANPTLVASVPASHKDTPTTVDLDTQGRVYKTEELDAAGGTPLVTTLTRDVVGNPIAVTDARANATSSPWPTQTQSFDLLGRSITSSSADGGDTTVLLDIGGAPRLVWSSGDLAVETEFDAVHRPVRVWEWNTAASTKVLRERYVYGEAIADPIATPPVDPADSDLRGRLYRVYDAGCVDEFAYDWKGRVTSTTRRFFADDEADVDWSSSDPVAYPYDPTAPDDAATVAALASGADAVLETDTYPVTDAFDAFDRLTERTTPDGSVTTRTYDDGGAFNGVAVDGTGFVDDVQYNARGQRDTIAYGNGVTTSYTYDPDTFRLATLSTTRASDSVGLQGLTYSYDAVGNVLGIADAVQKTVYFNNSVVAADQTFAYDALYRLTNAWGREKSARGRVDWADPDYGDVPAASETCQLYEQRYTYDAVGNIGEMRHLLGGSTSWVRTYAYASASNQLATTTETAGTLAYQHDARGNIVFLPHLYNDFASPDPSPNVTWTYRNQMRTAQLNATDYAVYAYDRAGQRVRKVVKKGANVEDRRYVLGYEVWRKSVSGILDEERTTLHVMDDARRVAMVETKTVTGGSPVSSPVARVRYQLDNHLGSALVELDETGQIISYEEYYPYGSTSWWAGDSSVDVSRKRYRYTGMERDEETGLQCHGVRYYAPWLGRWTSADPIGLGDGSDPYAYCRLCPINAADVSGLAAPAMLPAPAAPSPAPPPAPEVPPELPWAINLWIAYQLGQLGGEAYFKLKEDEFARNMRDYLWDRQLQVGSATPAGTTLEAWTAAYSTASPALQSVEHEFLPYTAPPFYVDPRSVRGTSPIARSLRSENKQIPVYFVLRFPFPDVYSNTKNAIAGPDHQPSLLHRATQGIDERRAQAQAPLRKEIEVDGRLPQVNGFAGSIEEYPFASTWEGGPGATTSLIPLVENSAHGVTLSMFYYFAGVKEGDPYLVVYLDNTDIHAAAADIQAQLGGALPDSEILRMTQYVLRAMEAANASR